MTFKAMTFKENEFTGDISPRERLIDFIRAKELIVPVADEIDEFVWGLLDETLDKRIDQLIIESAGQLMKDKCVDSADLKVYLKELQLFDIVADNPVQEEEDVIVQSDTVECPKCGQDGLTETGLPIHIGRIHKDDETEEKEVDLGPPFKIRDLPQEEKFQVIRDNWDPEKYSSKTEYYSNFDYSPSYIWKIVNEYGGLEDKIVEESEIDEQEETTEDSDETNLTVKTQLIELITGSNKQYWTTTDLSSKLDHSRRYLNDCINDIGPETEVKKTKIKGKLVVAKEGVDWSIVEKMMGGYPILDDDVKTDHMLERDRIVFEFMRSHRDTNYTVTELDELIEELSYSQIWGSLKKFEEYCYIQIDTRWRYSEDGESSAKQTAEQLLNEVIVSSDRQFWDINDLAMEVTVSPRYLNRVIIEAGTDVKFKAKMFGNKWIITSIDTDWSDFEEQTPTEVSSTGKALDKKQCSSCEEWFSKHGIKQHEQTCSDHSPGQQLIIKYIMGSDELYHQTRDLAAGTGLSKTYVSEAAKGIDHPDIDARKFGQFWYYKRADIGWDLVEEELIKEGNESQRIIGRAIITTVQDSDELYHTTETLSEILSFGRKAMQVWIQNFESNDQIQKKKIGRSWYLKKSTVNWDEVLDAIGVNSSNVDREIDVCCDAVEELLSMDIDQSELYDSVVDKDCESHDQILASYQYAGVPGYTRFEKIKVSDWKYQVIMKTMQQNGALPAGKVASLLRYEQEEEAVSVLNMMIMDMLVVKRGNKYKLHKKYKKAILDIDIDEIEHLIHQDQQSRKSESTDDKGVIVRPQIEVKKSDVSEVPDKPSTSVTTGSQEEMVEKITNEIVNEDHDEEQTIPVMEIDKTILAKLVLSIIRREGSSSMAALQSRFKNKDLPYSLLDLILYMESNDILQSNGGKQNGAVSIDEIFYLADTNDVDPTSWSRWDRLYHEVQSMGEEELDLFIHQYLQDDVNYTPVKKRERGKDLKPIQVKYVEKPGFCKLIMDQLVDGAKTKLELYSLLDAPTFHGRKSMRDLSLSLKYLEEKTLIKSRLINGEKLFSIVNPDEFDQDPSELSRSNRKLFAQFVEVN